VFFFITHIPYNPIKEIPCSPSNSS